MIKPITINKILQKPSLWEGWVGFCLLLLLSSPLLAQSKKEKEKDIHNTKSSAIIDGVHYKLHTVEKGQTLFNIAKFYNLTVNDLVIDNPEAIDGIKPGEVIKIAIEKKKIITSADSSHFTLVKIQAGQTMYSLSKQYAITIEKLKVINPELNEGLKIGQVVKIPIEKKKTETVAKPTKTETPVVENKTINPKDEKKIAVAVSPVKITTVENVPVIDKVEEKELPSVTDYSGIKKSEYKIAFFLPFHVDEVNAIDMEKVIKGEEQLPNKTNVALQYFEGALLAIDSLKKQNVNVKIFVYDIDEKDSLNIANTLKKPELASMDLMIGPLYGSSFMPIASYAKEKHIAIVSPFTQLNKILFSNPYVCKLSPSSTLQIEQMAHYAVDTFQTQNIILINNISTKEAANYNSFKTTANEALLKAGHSPADSVKIAYGYGNVENLLSRSKTNVVVLLSNNQSPVTEFISKLNVLADKYKIVLFGLQSWMGYDNLDYDYLNNLSLHMPANNFIDYENNDTKKFIKKFRDNYKTEPEMYAYQGFDATYFFVSQLQKNGTGFLKTIQDNKQEGLETNYNFMQHPSDSGFENKYVYILKFKDYKLTRAN